MKQLELITAEKTQDSHEDIHPAREEGQPSPQPTVAPKVSPKMEHSTSAKMETVIRELPAAFAKVAKNQGAPGPDGQTLEEVRSRQTEILNQLGQSLRDGTYKPGEIRRAWIPKEGGEKRGLGIPNVVDRIVQAALVRVLEPECERIFHPNSHGFRPNRSCHTAIRQAKDFVDEGFQWVVDIDLARFFDEVNHQRLMARLAQIEPDREVLILVGKLIKAKTVMPDGLVKANERGVPQGGPLSALLSNIVLNELDWKLEERGHKFVRYADDCKIYVRSERAGHRVMASTSAFIVRKLRLRINESKSAVARPRERHFVGFRLATASDTEDDDEVEIRLSKRSIGRIKSKLKELTPRNWGRPMQDCIDRINKYLGGWIGFFGIIGPSDQRLLGSIEARLRRRLRAIQLKQWKRKQTIARKLIGLGARPKTAWKYVYQGAQRIWALSRSPVLNSTLNRKYFDRLGLLSLREAWERRQQQLRLASAQLTLF